MKAMCEPSLRSLDISGPTSAVIVALAGAGLVALGLLLVGTREIHTQQVSLDYGRSVQR